jgi:hypothetical protein
LAVRAAALLVLAFLPLAGCADDAPEAVTPHAFKALYGPVGPDGYGMELELRPATMQADRDLAPHAAYTLTQVNPPDGYAGTYSLDAKFRVVRHSSSCLGRDDCMGQWMTWPDALEPNLQGVGWTLYPPADANRSVDHGRVVFERSGLRYEYEGGHLAPSRILHETRDKRCKEFPCEDIPVSGQQLLAYDVTGALGSADEWPAPMPLLANQTRSFLVHPGEDQDFLGLGWTTKDAMDHLAADPNAGPILADGGCVLAYTVLKFSPSAVALPLPVLPSGDATIDVALQDREGRSTRWWFVHQSNLLGPAFSQPEGSELWPFKGGVSCDERRQAPVPRLSVADAWARSKPLVKDPGQRDFLVTVYQQPPSHENGGFSPDNYGFEATAAFFAADGDGAGSQARWDLWRDSLVELFLANDDGPAPS